MTEEPPQLPVYIVTSTNWTMEVPLDEYNAQFDKESQLFEAATRAVEVFKLMREDCRIVMNPDSRDENPFLGTTVLVHLKGTNPETAAVIFTHVCLGNTGLYKDAKVMEEELQRQIEVLRKKQEAREELEKKLSKQAQMLPDLAPKRKTRKKK